MLIFLATLLSTLYSILRSRTALELENLALRHQIGVLQRSARNRRPKLTALDRLLWAWLSRVWSDWRSALAIVQPETVIAWHRKGFRLFWVWKIRRGQPGRPTLPREVRDLIRRMCRENPTWGAPRIHGELLKLGINVGESSVSKYMVRSRKPPSQTWRTFLENHAKQLVSIDFFTVPTIRFQVLYVFLVLAHDRRRILHFNVTANPTAEWTGHQLREAFPFDQLPRYLLRDRDAIFGEEFRQQITDVGIHEVLSTPRSPWQRAYIERVIGSIRREVGMLARQLFPGGVEVHGDDLDQEIRATRELTADREVPAIFEGTFEHGGVLVRVDILNRWRDGCWRLIEVKSTTDVKDHHVGDVAIQHRVVIRSGVDLAASCLSHVSREYVYEGGPIDAHRLFKIRNLTRRVKKSQPHLPYELRSQFRVLQMDEAPRVPAGPQCNYPAIYGLCKQHSSYCA